MLCKRCVWIAAILCLLTGPLTARQSGAAREYSIPGHGSLRLAVPDGWRVSTKSLSQPLSVLLRMSPPTGEAFDVQLTSVWLDSAALAKRSPDSIKSNVQRTASGLLPQAVEKTITMQELRGTQTAGYYFALTDRNPAPGEYKYLMQGSFLTGELLSVFTLLSHAPRTPEVEQALEAFRTATYSK